MDISNLEQILELLKKHGVNEFELTQEGVQLKLTRGVIQNVVAHAAQALPVEVQQAVSYSGHAPAEAQANAKPSVPEGWVKIESPIVGTFYRKPSPDKENFVKEGDVVKKGDTLCIVEAMKLMNEIEAKISGKIEKIVANDGQVVEFGELLFYINPNA